jgi:SAM-dependent methyltransferase
MAFPRRIEIQIYPLFQDFVSCVRRDLKINIEDIKGSLRRIDRDEYPELQRYSDEEIWRDLGPGGLYLVAKMSREMNLKEDDIVLDLGCGRGESSIFLTKHFGVQVIAADLWIARKPLPFAEEYFDAIFCMNSLSFFGGDLETLNRLSTHLKQGGVFCVGGECMSEQFTPEQISHPPKVYSFVKGIWENDFLKLHSPPWWENLFERTAELEVVTCKELGDGITLFEEEILSSAPVGYLGLSPQQAREIEIRQIVYGQTNKPYMTIFLLTALKKAS